MDFLYLTLLSAMIQLRKFGQWLLLCNHGDAELVLPLLEDYYLGKSCSGWGVVCKSNLIICIQSSLSIFS